MEPKTDIGSYFDEAYFQRGWERGTAYENYKTSAASSPIFKDVSQGIATIFCPVRALEIGCATGPIVFELNRLGIPTWGIDVSKWAVENAMHQFVLLASADDLPFESGSFDFVYSSHALEHLPEEIYESAFREIDRVCSANAIQFHMLPIIGTHPYNYDHETARTDLKKDPTHNLLNTMEWWIQKWAALGWEPLPISIFFLEDTANAELSSGQFCLIRKGSSQAYRLLDSINRWNGAAYRKKYMLLQDMRERRGVPLRLASHSELIFPSLGPAPMQWDDLKRDFIVPVDLTSAEIAGIVQFDATENASMRIALITERGSVLEKWITISPGLSCFNLSIEQFSVLSGDGNTGNIKSIYFGGMVGDFQIRCNIALRGPILEIDAIFGN